MAELISGRSILDRNKSDVMTSRIEMKLISVGVQGKIDGEEIIHSMNMLKNGKAIEADDATGYVCLYVGM